MPRDTPLDAALPGWLAPGLLDALARGIEAELARGIGHDQAMKTAHERARALRPAMPATYIAEAVAIVAWLVRTPPE